MDDFLRFRPCVGCVLLNKEGMIFVGRRPDLGDDPVLGWQMPQGGAHDDEPLEEALLRELDEEVGTTNVSIIGIYDKWLFYRFPKELYDKGRANFYKDYIGQRQKWFLCRFEGDDSEIVLDKEVVPEFVQWRWAMPNVVVDMVVDFKKDIYREVIGHFMSIIDGEKSLVT